MRIITLAGLLTYSFLHRLPNRRTLAWSVAFPVLKHLELTAAGLFEILTRFPFNRVYSEPNHSKISVQRYE